MFSFASSKDHSVRKRIIASAYSKTAISQPRTQSIISSCTSKLVDFLEKHTDNISTHCKPVVVRNVFRALQSDLFSAFAFSEEAGTAYLDRLQVGPNTLEDLGMVDMDMLHDEKRDAFFFWESETPFKYLTCLIDPNGRKAHRKAEFWLLKLVSRHMHRSLTRRSTTRNMSLDSSIYDKLQEWSDPQSGRAMNWKEKASEVKDHAGRGVLIVSVKVQLMHDSSRTRCGPSSPRIHSAPGFHSFRRPI